MPLVNNGATMIAATLIGGGTPISAANARIGVGDSTAAFAATQTDLQATTNKLRKAVDSGFPTQSANQITISATFGTTEANWAWNEWGVFNAASGATSMLSRKQEALGTKPNTEAWQLAVTLTINVG